MSRAYLTPLVLALALAACGDRDTAEEPTPTIGEPGETEEPVSIIRDDVRAEAGADLVEEEGPIRAIIGFPDGGSNLDDDAVAALEALLDPEWVRGEQTVYLWGHSDTVGSDAANFRAGEARALAVANFLEERGVDRERFEIVSLGEGNPAQPNYLPDGSDNVEGQRANRRVVIQVGDLPEPAGPDAAPVDGSEPTP
ncbi:OmpA family protein [Sphingomicrobium clamense]|uniref:OmpA family protein n=1 Tax=Sphingomicrobium clamense TaxID=2851013 RepID=A0ABS6V758_9SPHN|nr:OmpA family protein [Sphingomicrobium sp. B8]MBW0145405.1 OmpA family protein [Sphingomicrobium sp. B8]